jgi:hypothetical protein
LGEPLERVPELLAVKTKVRLNVLAVVDVVVVVPDATVVEVVVGAGVVGAGTVVVEVVPGADEDESPTIRV